ncbi:MAG: metallophosphoesterase [Deltaproteobacteria bacterium]
MIRFIHSSDLHLGKPFGRFPEDVRARLKQARESALDQLATLAKSHAASHILLAGDTFDQMTPAPSLVRQTLNKMGQAGHVTWVLMPGNHDHANATELWRQVLADAPKNVILAHEPMPITLADHVALLPAPPTERRPGRDLTDWFDSADTGDAIRIGLAHGSVTGFAAGEDGEASIIAPDRARRARLAYLGLGDWHGQLKIGAETWYSGAPEADSFKHTQPPAALLVEIAGRTAPAQVTSVPTGSIHWRQATLDLSEDQDGPAAHAAALPPLNERALTMFDLTISGHTRALNQVALEQAAAKAAPDFLSYAVDLSALSMAHDTSDLDAIAQHGALRAAAEALARDADDATLPDDQRASAQSALSYLFTYALET